MTLLLQKVRQFLLQAGAEAVGNMDDPALLAAGYELALFDGLNHS